MKKPMTNDNHSKKRAKKADFGYQGSAPIIKSKNLSIKKHSTQHQPPPPPNNTTREETRDDAHSNKEAKGTGVKQQ